MRAWASFCVFSVTLVCGIAAAPLRTSAAPTEAPNIVVIMSDDQPYYSVEEMPYVSSLDGLEPLDVLYDNVALCCPARATFLTGLYSHHTGVESNLDGDRFNPGDTLATWLNDGGYETGMFGKYFLTYPFGQGDGGVPPGWDRWVAFGRGHPDYYDYTLNFDGVPRQFGDGIRDYSTDVLARKAKDFVEAAPEPFFALVTPFGPHATPPGPNASRSATDLPATPASRHAGAYRNTPFPLRPNFGLAAQGAPRFYKRLPAPSLRDEQTVWRRQMETLQSVDDLVETVVTEADQRQRETIVVYLSDNGYSLGSHRWPTKVCGYEECGRIPGLIRSPGDPSEVLASIADLAPTLAHFAEVPASPTDGESLVSAFAGTPQDPDRALLLRNGTKADIPPFWGLRTQQWKYLRHGFGAGAEGESERPEELYDLEADPFELSNLAGDPAYASELEELRARLKVERSAPPR